MGATKPVECECPIHGRFETKPHYLLKGVECKHCSNTQKGVNRRVSSEDFLMKLAKNNKAYREGKFKVVGTYIKSDIPIPCECAIHGTWETTTPSSLLLGRGCPNCANENRRESNIKSTQQFLKELYSKNTHYCNGEFRVVGVYTGSKVPIECECPIHGLWTPIPNNMLSHNTGCPKCRYKKTWE